MVLGLGEGEVYYCFSSCLRFAGKRQRLKMLQTSPGLLAVAGVMARLQKRGQASTGLYGLVSINQTSRKGEEPGWRDIDRHRPLL